MANLVADARALSAGQYSYLVVYGSTVVGDGGGGFYIWDGAASNADDGADWIKPNSVDGGSPGRWGRVWSASGTITTFGRDLIDSADASAARTTLGLGTMALEAAADFISTVSTPTAGNFPVLTAGGELNNSTYSNGSFATAAQGTLAGTALQPADVGTIASQNANSVAITGGSITGITDLAIAEGGTGQSTAVAAFTALKQPATDTATGVVELATSAEVITGTDTTRAVTAAGVAAAYWPLSSKLHKSITIVEPTATEKVVLFFTPVALTVSNIRSLVAGTTPSVTFSIRHGSDFSASGTEVVTSGTTCTSSSTGVSTTSFNAASISANSWVWLTTSAMSGTVTAAHVTVVF